MSSERRFWLQLSAALALVLGGLGWAVGQWHLSGFSGLVADRLMLLNELRKDALEEYLDTARAELRFWSISPDILASQRGFARFWDGAASGPGHYRQMHAHYGEIDSNRDTAPDTVPAPPQLAAYTDLHQALHPMARRFVTSRGYYDFFLLGLDGSVYYTVEKESDFAGSLTTGSLRDSHLAEVFRRALTLEPGQVAISDLRSYGPSAGAPAMFVALAIRDGDTPLGVIAFQLPTSRIVSIMNYTVGMGDTGETYLVGQDHLMRSNSRFSETSTILRQRVDTATVLRGLAGEIGTGRVADYRDVEVLSAFDSVQIGQTRWAMMAEIDHQEVVTLAAADRPALAGPLLFLYGLSLWTAWYWRGRDLHADGPDGGVGDDLVADTHPPVDTGAGGSIGLGD